jgi:hypothetical protein
MYYPHFFDTLPTIRLQDDLSNFLGTFEDGIVEFSYLDIVKAAGHSCPTVSGAYLLTLFGLKELYKDKLPKRGEIKVSFQESFDEGVVGVIANVISHITGATQANGFKGIGGKFARYGLMEFNSQLQPNATVRFERVDTNRSIELVYDSSDIPSSPEMEPLMHLVMQNKATEYEKKLFGKLWQQRVEYIFLNKEKVITTL